MDFANRGTRPAQTENGATSASVGQAPKSSKGKNLKAAKIMQIMLLFSVTLMAVAVILLFVFGVRNNDESQFVDKKKYQAVFLNGGQVYFGKIGEFNGKYLTLSDIYYLRVNQQVQPGQTTSQNDVSLAKLGNELHGPEDRMVINKTEIQFWENLKDDGQVVKAITEYKKNPSAANSQTSTSTTNSTTSTQQTSTSTNSTKKQ